MAMLPDREAQDQVPAGARAVRCCDFWPRTLLP